MSKEDNLNEFTQAQSVTLEWNGKHQAKPEQPRVVKDTFTFPEKEHGLIDLIINKLLDDKISMNKSEVIRAGLHALNNLSQDDLVKAFKNIERVKTGRPKQR